MVEIPRDFSAIPEPARLDEEARQPDAAPPAAGAIPTTCIETIGGDPASAIRLSFQIKVF